MPTTFIDGPAAGASLMLHRAPVYLRVVIDASSGGVDALDQLDDVPAPGESLHAYQWDHADPALSRFHIRCSRGSKTPSGWYESANYRLVPDQPSDEIMRDVSKWREWCQGRGSNG